MGKEPYVPCEFHCALGNAGEHGKREVIHFPAVSLAAHSIGGGHAHLFGDLCFQSLHLFRVSPKQFQKTGTRSGSPPASQKPQIPEDPVQMLQIHHKILHPEAGSLSRCGGLRGLEMGIGQGRGIGIPVGKPPHGTNGAKELFPHKAQGVPLQEEIRVVAHVAAGGAQMDYRLC